MRTFYFSRLASPVGPLTVAVTERGLARLEFDGRQVLPQDGETWTESEEKTRPYREQLLEYFAGRRKQFDFSLDLEGTEFEKCCWQALLAIPYGETRTYADLARAVGQPKAFRAVGRANHDNPIAIVVPCHRVIGTGGSLTGYGGGLEIKKKLLELEKGTRQLF
jgi:O-6-methylguanine DNA methyltransferase